MTSMLRGKIFGKRSIKRKNRVDKAWFIIFLFMKSEAPIPNIMLEFMNIL
jgi:hypothetical protein